MNYQHSYHAGNFPDVFKHWILVLLLEKLQQKTTPFGVLDTHGGGGFYDLHSEKSQKTQEYKDGIDHLFKSKPIPAAFQSYLDFVKQCQLTPDKLAHYPGSPYIIQNFLREHDSLITCELHNETYHHLKENLDTWSNNIAVHEQDAYLGMKAFLPLKEKRGLVLIDPPFEKTDEFTAILKALEIALHRFQQGIYAIWYPIKHRPPVRAFHEQLTLLAPGKVLIVEALRRDDNDSDRLNGCGMAIINPPWHLQEVLTSNLPWLVQQFAQDHKARCEISLL